MPDNFYRTAERCHSAAITLAADATDHKHLCCYLSGYVVECAAKQIVMVEINTSANNIYKNFSHRVTELADFVRWFGVSPSGHSIPVTHLPDFHSDAPQIIAKWNPNKRYSDNSGWDSACSMDFIREATTIMTKLASLRAAGII